MMSHGVVVCETVWLYAETYPPVMARVWWDGRRSRDAHLPQMSVESVMKGGDQQLIHPQITNETNAW